MPGAGLAPEPPKDPDRKPRHFKREPKDAKNETLGPAFWRAFKMPGARLTPEPSKDPDRKPRCTKREPKDEKMRPWARHFGGRSKFRVPGSRRSPP